MPVADRIVFQQSGDQEFRQPALVCDFFDMSILFCHVSAPKE